MGLLVDFDYQAAQQLVEVVFQTVFFGVSYFDNEFHRLQSFADVFSPVGRMDYATTRGGV